MRERLSKKDHVMFIVRLFILGLLFSGVISCQMMEIDDDFLEPEKYKSRKSVEEGVSNKKQSILSVFLTLSNTSFRVEDERKAQQVLENNFTYQKSRWWTKDKEIEITPIRIFSKIKGEFCREYHAKLISNNDKVDTKSVACRKNGVWFRQNAI